MGVLRDQSTRIFSLRVFACVCGGGWHGTVVVSPDAGGVYRAKKFREGLAHRYGLDAGLAMIIKQRAKANEVWEGTRVCCLVASSVNCARQT